MGIVVLAAVAGWFLGVLGGWTITYSVWWILALAQAGVGIVSSEWVCRHFERPDLVTRVYWLVGLVVLSGVVSALLMIDMIDARGRWRIAADAAYMLPWFWLAITSRVQVRPA